MTGDAARTQPAAPPPERGPELLPELLGELDRVALDAMARTVAPALPARAEEAAGFEEVARALRAAPRHAGLLRCWLRALHDAGRVSRDAQGRWHRGGAPAGPAATGAADDAAELDAYYAELGFPPAMARYHRAALGRLPDLLSDRTTAQDLLFDGEDVLAALGAYQRNVFTAHLDAACADLARTAAADDPGPLRVVELGGGTGNTTGALLRALADTSAQYVFTDVSRAFTEHAAARFGLRTALLDVDADFPEQGFPPGSADLVVAGNMLHNASHIGRTLRRVRQLLAPGGRLLLTESVRDTPAVLTSMRFLLSPPAGSPHADRPERRFADRRAGTDDVFLDAAQWHAELAAAGFEVDRVLPPASSPFAAAGQKLWYAAAPHDPEPAGSASASLAPALKGRGEEPVCEIDGRGYAAKEVLAAVDAPFSRALPAPAGHFFDGLARALRTGRDALDEGGGAAPDGATGERLAVLAGDAAGARGAVAAWAGGGQVLCAAPDTAPARLLAWLERTAATEAVLPAALLRALPKEPAAALTDLDALRRVRPADGPSGAGDAEAWHRLGVELAASEPESAPQPAPESAQGPDPAPPGIPDAAERAAVAGDAALDGLDTDAALHALRLVDVAARRSMLEALRRAGLFTAPEVPHTAEEILTAARVAPAHHRLVRRWLTALEEDGTLARSGTAHRLARGRDVAAGPGPAWDEAERHWNAVFGGVDTVEYARRSAAELPALLAGERRPFTLLFPEGRTETARALYRESLTGRYQHHALTALVASHLEQQSPQGRPRRVVEVGGGTGATTEVLLPALSRLAGPPVDYLFTDVSRFFLDHARERFAQGAPPGAALRTGLLDIDREPEPQGYTPGTWDAVVAGGVLNAAADTDASLRALARLLVPGGLLVLTEPTAEENWVLISQAFMMAAPRDARAASGTGFLSLPQWHAALDGAGLLRTAELPPDGHPLEPLGHRVFAARTPPANESAAHPRTR